jgi:hypothetical protein
LTREDEVPFPFHVTIVVTDNRVAQANALASNIPSIADGFGNSWWAESADPATISHSLVDARVTVEDEQPIKDAFSGLNWTDVYWGENSIAQAMDDLGIVPWQPAD